MEAGIAQAILAVTLAFGMLMMLPKALMLLRAGRRSKGIMYLLMTFIFAFFTTLAISYSVGSFMKYYGKF
ncbi:MAG: hypothetical protein M0Z59_02620 [Nitrospiraceae bacterium]|nr:hypothetical protein [Nitrospiraceae bacterium]